MIENPGALPAGQALLGKRDQQVGIRMIGRLRLP
jgi:hypothetical protein